MDNQTIEAIAVAEQIAGEQLRKARAECEHLVEPESEMIL